MRKRWVIMAMLLGLGQLVWDLWQRRELEGRRIVSEPPGAQVYYWTTTERGSRRYLAGKCGQPLHLPNTGIHYLDIELAGYKTKQIPGTDLGPGRYPMQGAIALVPKSAWVPWLAAPGYWLAGILGAALLIDHRRGRRRRTQLENAFAQGRALPGQKIGPYQVVATLGSGGMATVYEVFLQDAPHERRALKLLFRPGGGERFVREARLSVGLRHPNLVAFYDYGEFQGRAYLVMEKISGLTLDQAHLSLPQRLNYLSQVAQGLAALHEKSILHRDIKPSNIMISGPKALLMDFGIARSLHEQALTLEGQAVGTPGYMAPEQILGDEPGPAADLYSLGVVLYEACGGRLPYEAETSFELITKQLQLPPRPLQELRPDLPAELTELAMQMLGRDPLQRPSSAKQVSQQLRDWAQRLEAV